MHRCAPTSSTTSPIRSTRTPEQSPRLRAPSPIASAYRGVPPILDAQELRAKGIAEELINSTVAQVKGGELASARTVWTKKFGSLPTDAKQRAKQMRFLQSRGFSMEVIRQVLQGLDDED